MALSRFSGWRRWAYIGPALLWTLAFFVLPLLIMTLYSFWQRVGGKLVTDYSLANYERFFAKDYFLKALTNSLEVTLLTVVIRRYPRRSRSPP